MLYNNTYHESTGFTPIEILFGDSNKMTFDSSLPKSICNNENVHNIRNQVKENLKINSEKRKLKFNKSHKLIIFHIGDLVKIRKLNKSNAQNKTIKKFELLYEGPFVVSAVPFPNVYTLTYPGTVKVRGNFNTIHLNKYYK